MPSLLAAGPRGSHLDLLNAVRSPVEWKKLHDTKLKVCLAGNRTRLLERIGAAAGLRPRWCKSPSFDAAAWWHKRAFCGDAGGTTDAWEVLSQILDRVGYCGQGEQKPDFNLVLEPDAIVVLPEAEALEFWKKWWADEQAKKK